MKNLEGMNDVDAIVAAHNEEPTIGAVVRTLVASHRFRDVIVVSDGSADKTAQEARNAGASHVIEIPHQGGKGAALIRGVSSTDARTLFFCDADLRGLDARHIDAVLAPVVAGKRAMNVGLRDRGPFLLKLMPYLPLIGGERALRREIFDAVPDRLMQGFMVESALNYACRRRHLPYGSVPLPGLTIRRKMEKVGMLRGLVGYVQMTYQIIRSIILVRFASWHHEF